MEDSDVEVRDDAAQGDKGGERGRTSMRMEKGKGKQKDLAEERRDSGKQSVKEEPMDVDVELNQLTKDA